MWKRSGLASALWFLIVPMAFAQDASNLAMGKIWNQAELNNDAKALQLILAEDFMMTVGDGYTLNKKDMLGPGSGDKTYKPTLLQSRHARTHAWNGSCGNGEYHERGTDKQTV